MGKEFRDFTDYHSNNNTIPYRASHICCCLTQYAKDYIRENHPIISNVDTKVRDAVLVDAINYMGLKGWCDFALYTEDLYDGRRHEETVDPEQLLTVVVNHYSYYMFNSGIVESVLRNNHMNECNEPFDANDGAIVLLDFINYIAKRNDFDRTFTIQDLHKKYKLQKYISDLNQLKKFLELSGKYSEDLAWGRSIRDIYKCMANEHNLQYVSKDGTFHYTKLIRERVGHSEMYSWDAEKVEEEIYAMAYAYAKSKARKKSNVRIIDEKLSEMKKR